MTSVLCYAVDSLALACAVVCTLQLYNWSKRGRPSFPPGPKGLPIIGNVFDLRGAEMWELGRQFGEKYGSLVYIKNFTISYVFVNSYDAAIDLFEKRGSIYSSRPLNTMTKLEGWDWMVSSMPYGDELRRSRQLLHRFFHAGVCGEYAEIQTQSTYRMLARLLGRPESFLELLRQSAGETIIMLAYGRLPKENDPYIELAEKGIAAAGRTVEPFLVNALPILQYLPSWLLGTDFKRIVKEGHKLSLDMYREPYRTAKLKIAEGTAAPSMISKLLDARMTGDPVINDESLIAKVTAITYAAGADTTVSALHSFFLAMLLHPDVQKRAQEELDRVVGKDTLPSFDDRQNLPFVEAIVKETMRWQPVLPLAVPHVVTEDDIYNGYFIPAGAQVLPNVWAMFRDSNLYPELDKFVPERWLATEGSETPLDVHKIFFGFGRRICSGRHFADSSVRLPYSRPSTSKAFDEKGVPIIPKADYMPQVVRHPKPFKYVLTLRSEKIKSVICQAVDA